MIGNRIKLLIILEATLGGIRKHVVDLLFGLDKGKFDITFIYSLRRADETFIMQHRLLEGCGITMIEVDMTDDVNPVSYSLAAWKVHKLITTIRPDVLHLHGAKAGAIGRIAATFTSCKRIIYTPHGGAFHRFESLPGKLFLFIERMLLFNTSFVIGVSADSCYQAEKYLKISSNICRCIYNGLDINEIDAIIGEGQAAHRKESCEELSVIYPALLLEAKGHIKFIEAVSRSSKILDGNIKIYLVGDGPLHDRICDSIKKHHLETMIIMKGFRNDLLNMFADCDLVLLPSMNEAFPYVLLEAMACSKPVIATHVGGIPEIVLEKYNGRLIPPDRLDEIIDILNHYNIHREELVLMGKNGRTLVEAKLSIQAMIEKTEELYLEAVSSPS